MSARDLAFSRNLIKRFIALYKESPCLWNRKCIAYKHKQKRNEAIARLTELVRKHDPTATKVHVLRKIESMRACVRREYKKVQASISRAKCDDDVYVPHLWYYKLLSFAFTDESDDNKMKVEFEAEEDSVESDNPDVSEDTFEPAPHVYTDYAITSNVLGGVPDSSVYKHTEDDSKRKQHCTEVDDEYDAIGINVAAKLRGLPSNMRILAEKLINDVLFQAQTNTLSSSTTITTPDPFKYNK
ncbi:uncharacterized protein LOC119831870 [Zerene cesonia]|uniref:uncharacterized protein LOC119831870 n=1 Tax=Zerene cesonia TaxID=33412 RepID=UPI0018E589FD|nr:uncharacterized protein LOC119831870 [Zerene cesonia]